ncbi:hypothetical protein M422DRAFT_35625 [Sphaerobolus stellatus SS14]|uniref:C2H2-type domain-containing protein n=1 Tax=Sphaerobolus stellatus (strain SS14) TaxID=990650 RepID=A0A0C9TS19_SPHS4|nr:hypothetical protein M422DRAFT_35625 [Sphaerobolus stellatus SS14]
MTCGTFDSPFNPKQISRSHPRLVLKEDGVTWSCGTCGRSFQDVESANLHIFGDLGIFLCSGCQDISFGHERFLKKHYPKECYYSFIHSFYKVERPPQTGHIILPVLPEEPRCLTDNLSPTQKPYECICGATFKEPHNARLHVMHEYLVYACRTCNKRFKRQDEAKNHRNCASGRNTHRSQTASPSYNSHIRTGRPY